MPLSLFSAPLPSCSMSPAPQHKIQLILIGDRSVGKTCVMERFTDDIFHGDITSTVGESTLFACSALLV